MSIHQPADYISKRVGYTAQSLQKLLRAHDKTLELNTHITPHSKKIKLEITQRDRKKNAARFIGDLRGKFEICPATKKIILYIPHKDAPKKTQIAFDYPGKPGALVLFEALKHKLPQNTQGADPAPQPKPKRKSKAAPVLPSAPKPPADAAPVLKPSALKHIPHLSASQQDYVRERVLAAANSLQHRLHQVNNTLKVDAIVYPAGKKIKIEILKQNHTKTRLNYVTGLSGKFEMCPRTQKITMYIPHKDAPKRKEISFLYRGRSAADTIFDLVFSQLPVQAQQQRAENGKSLNASIVMAADSAPAQACIDLPVKMPIRHKDFISAHTLALETKFAQKFSAYFNDNGRRNARPDITFDPDITTLENGGRETTMEMRFSIKDKFRKAGAPRVTVIKGKLGFRPETRGGTPMRLDFTPVSGLPSRNAAYQAIHLTRRKSDVCKEIFNLLVASKILVNTAARPARENPLPAPAPERRDRRQPHRQDVSRFSSTRKHVFANRR